MKSLPAVALALSAFFGAACPLCAEDPKDALAPPLRQYDKDGDGKLTGDELTLARQAHRRGGRPAEPTPDRWQEILERYRGGWMERNAGAFDTDGKPGLSDSERKEANRIWRQTADLFLESRLALVKKYDRDDDGELNGRERDNSRREGERARGEIEDKVMQEYRAAREKEKEAAEKEKAPPEKTPASASPAPSEPGKEKPKIPAPVVPPAAKG